MNESFIPLLKPQLPTATQLFPYLTRIDDSAWYTNFGPLNQLLCDRIASRHAQSTGRQAHVVTTSSATLGLELLIASLKLKPNSKILIPAFTFIATASAIKRCGHIPVVADVDPLSWLLTPQSLGAHTDLSEIAAIIPVAIFGMPVDMTTWEHWKKSHQIPVIVDAASGFGAQGTSAEIPAVISMHATKSFSSAEGGLILTENEGLAEDLKKLTNFGIGLNGQYDSTNAKLSEYHAAIGNASLDQIDATSQRRLSLYHSYIEKLTTSCGEHIRFQQNTGLYAPSIFPIVFQTNTQRSQVEHHCAANNIGTRRWYQPLVQDHADLAGIVQHAPTPHSETLADTMLGIPFFIEMSTQHQITVVDTIAAALKN